MIENKIICGEMPKATKEYPDNFFDAIVTDIPYGIGFMGKEWDTFKTDYLNKHRVADRKRKPRTDGRKVAAWNDGADAGTYDYSRNAEYQEWCRVWSAEALRIAKPGAFLLCFGGTRTYHRVTCGLEDAGWQIRDCLTWLYGSGFPKSHNISKAIDKAKGAEREIIGTMKHTKGRSVRTFKGISAAGQPNSIVGDVPETAPATNLAKLWDGYGTALKPAWEPIIVAMKPLDGTFAQNAEKHGVAGLNIDGGRIGTETITAHGGGKQGNRVFGMGEGIPAIEAGSNPHQGRWPANVILDEEAAAMLDEQSGESKSIGGTNPMKQNKIYGKRKSVSVFHFGDSGGASRFFYCAKASRSERNAGLEEMEAKFSATMGNGIGKREHNPDESNAYVKNNHPTVKPLKLMEYLCTLLKPPGEHPILLDPFCGSGTTLMAAFNTGWDYVGIDKEAEYVEIAKRRVAWCKDQVALFEKGV